MSRQIAPFGIRMEEGLRAQLVEAAHDSGRSLNSEAVQRLASTFERPAEHAKDCRLTKRELIAAMALQGLASVPSPGGVTTAGIAHDVGAAVVYADALLAELAKEPQA